MSEAEITLVVGATGAGKTTLLDAVLAPAKFHIVMTTKPGGYTTRQGWKQVSRWEDLHGVLMKNYHLDRCKICLRVLSGPKNKLLPIISLHKTAIAIHKLQDIARIGKFIKPIGLTVDEAHLFYPHNLPDDMDAFGWFVAQIREWKVHIVFATQRPTNIPPTFRDNVKNMYVLRLGGDTAVKKVKEFVGAGFVVPKQYQYALYVDGELAHKGSTRKPKLVHKLP